MRPSPSQDLLRQPRPQRAGLAHAADADPKRSADGMEPSCSQTFTNARRQSSTTIPQIDRCTMWTRMANRRTWLDAAG
jgi:hypothetical protein